VSRDRRRRAVANFVVLFFEAATDRTPMTMANESETIHELSTTLVRRAYGTTPRMPLIQHATCADDSRYMHGIIHVW